MARKPKMARKQYEPKGSTVAASPTKAVKIKTKKKKKK